MNKTTVIFLLALCVFVSQLACQVTFTTAPTATPDDKPGSKRSNPAPVGTVIIDEKEGLKIEVKEVVRGEKLIVESGVKAKPGEEHLIISVSVTCTKSPDEQCNIAPYLFEVVGSKDIENRTNELFTYLAVEKIEPKNFYGGNTTIEGWIPFSVQKDDRDIVLIFSGTNKFYILLPQGKHF